MTEKTSNRASQDVVSLVEELHRQLRRAAVERISATEYASGAFFELSTMFQAIRELAGKDSLVGQVAGVGRYLADDWGNSLDCMRYEAQEALDAMEGGAV